MKNSVFAFDLDGTITAEEILPNISKELGIYDEIQLLTKLTLEGVIDFTASFKLRFQILRSIPVGDVQRIVASTPLNPHIERFIHDNAQRCAIVTGNLDCWVEPLVQRLGCRCLCSTSKVCGTLLQLDSVLDKGQAIRKLAREFSHIVAIGESVNDLPMFEEANVGIAFGGVHEPVPDLISIADFVTYDGEALCRLLQTL